jgi:hypothetical protein
MHRRRDAPLGTPGSNNQSPRNIDTRSTRKPRSWRTARSHVYIHQDQRRSGQPPRSQSDQLEAVRSRHNSLVVVYIENRTVTRSASSFPRAQSGAVWDNVNGALTFVTDTEAWGSETPQGRLTSRRLWRSIVSGCVFLFVIRPLSRSVRWSADTVVRVAVSGSRSPFRPAPPSSRHRLVEARSSDGDVVDALALLGEEARVDALVVERLDQLPLHLADHGDREAPGAPDRPADSRSSAFPGLTSRRPESERGRSTRRRRRGPGRRRRTYPGTGARAHAPSWRARRPPAQCRRPSDRRGPTWQTMSRRRPPAVPAG